MTKVYLTKPNVDLEEAYIDMIKDWEENDKSRIPWFMHLSTLNFAAMVNRLIGLSEGIEIEEGFVENTTLWLVNENRKVLGAINIRHRLNELFLNYGGQIGYGIRPSERRKGYGKEILRLGLEACREIGLERVLICCNEDNEGSIRTVLSNGGLLYSKGVYGDENILKYWITVE